MKKNDSRDWYTVLILNTEAVFLQAVCFCLPCHIYDDTEVDLLVAQFTITSQWDMVMLSQFLVFPANFPQVKSGRSYKVEVLVPISISIFSEPITMSLLNHIQSDSKYLLILTQYIYEIPHLVNRIDENPIIYVTLYR